MKRVMSGQLTFDEVAKNRLPRWHRGGLETERLAALDCYARTGSQRFRVLFELAGAGERGRTDYELGETLRILRTSAGKRRKELMEAGLVEASGGRRITDTGSTAIVWVLTEKGREVATLLIRGEGGVA